MISSTRHFRKATIKEVAAQAGVSTTTVSLFVKGRETVCSPQTGARIKEAISQLNYTPSALTRGLHRSASATLGVCLPHPLDVDLSYGSSFFEQIWRGILQQADHEDYALLHFPESVRNGLSCDSFLDGRIDGLLLLEHENKRSPRILTAGMPMVLLLRSQDVPVGCSTVSGDEKNTVDLALGHLWALGHRRIAHVAGPVDQRPTAFLENARDPQMPHDDVACRRLEEYTSWMSLRKCFDPQLVGYAKGWSAPSASDILNLLLSQPKPPTAIFCANDAQAMNICEAATQRGLHIPRDLSVVGVDNSLAAATSRPGLTSVDVATDRIGREAVRELVRLLQAVPPTPRQVITPINELVVRGSTAPIYNSVK